MANEDKLHEFDVEVFSVGTWNGDKYSDKDLEDMEKNFAALGETIKPPVKLGHNEDQMKSILKDGHPALGWVKSLRKVGSKLVATLTSVPDIVYKAIKAGRYKRVSSEIYWNYKQEGKIFNRVFAGLALLGADIPAVTNLKDLEAYLTQSMQDASFERVATYAYAVNESGEIDINDNGKGEKPMSDETKIYTDKIAALEAENASLKEDAAKAKKYEADLEAIRKDQAEKRKTGQQTTLKEFCEQMVKDGKLPPAARDKLCDFGKLSYSDEAGYSIGVDTIIDVLKTFEKVILDTSEKGEAGKKEGKTSAKNVYDEVDQKAKAYIKEHKDVSYEDAMQAVLSEDEDLSKRYFSSTAIDLQEDDED